MFGLVNALPTSPWFLQPAHALRQAEVCANDGFLAVEGCQTERVLLPRDSHFEMLSPHNPRVNLEASGRYRVDSECESPGEMRRTSWFVLPPAEEFYYRRGHAEYRPVPGLRADCVARGAARGALALLYPDANGRVLIPGELDTNPGTFPMQSARLYQALAGTGGSVRYVTLPFESHGYSARESVGHTLWEMSEWMKRQVGPGAPIATPTTAEAADAEPKAPAAR